MFFKFKDRAKNNVGDALSSFAQYKEVKRAIFFYIFE